MLCRLKLLNKKKARKISLLKLALISQYTPQCSSILTSRTILNFGLGRTYLTQSFIQTNNAKALTYLNSNKYIRNIFERTGGKPLDGKQKADFLASLEASKSAGEDNPDLDEAIIILSNDSLLEEKYDQYKEEKASKPWWKL